MDDNIGNSYYNVIIDQDSLSIFRPDTIKRWHSLASGLSKGRHTIEVFKRTEYEAGSSTFYGFQIDGDAKLLPKPEPLKRSVEFYGNSITAGYAVEDTSGMDSPDSTFTNNYISYSSITARHFDANYHCICRSGIGITVSWFPKVMPEIYNRIDPKDDASQWNFSLYRPDIVVINLLQNDSWIVNMPEFEEYKKRFAYQDPDPDFIISAYQKFVEKLRSHYPDSHIICSLGCMDATREGSVWMEYITQAVSNLNDKMIYTHFMPYIEADAHPSIEDHEVMAKGLIEFIEENIEW